MDNDIWEKLEGKTVLVAGDFMLDRYIEGEVRRISPEAPVPVIEVCSEREVPGGAGNVINNVLALGGRARAAGYVGEDDAGRTLCGILRGRGADTSFLLREEGRPTTVKTRVVSENQQFLRFDKEKAGPPSAACLNDFREREEALFAGIDVVILSDYEKGFFTRECAQFFVCGAKKRGIPTVVDAKGTDFGRYCGADICTPNIKELSAASGMPVSCEEEIFAAAEKVRQESGVSRILVTRSEKGMSLIPGESGQKEDYPALAKEVVDVTGAGDTVASVVALGMAAGLPLSDCCKMANRAASVVVSKFGTATASRAELVGTSLAGKVAVPEKDAALLADGLRSQGKRIVFTNGCFDILHAGHISSFRRARELGDVLVVGLNSDASVRRIKGDKRPVIGESDRAALLLGLKSVDYVIIFGEDTPETLVRALRPDVLVKGRDWEDKQPVAGQRFVESYGGRVVFMELEEGLSTTSIINKIKDSYEKR